VDIIENIDEWRNRYAEWLRSSDANRGSDGIEDSYPFVKNKRAPFSPARRALPMLNLALITTSGAYLDGTEPFDESKSGGDLNFREIPTAIKPDDLRFAARGYDPAAVNADANSLVPIWRLFEFESNGIIGALNSVFWSLSSYIPDAAGLVEETAPRLIERIERYDVQAALLVPASRLCHQTVSLVARSLEASGIPTMTLAVDQDAVESVRPPRTALYAGELGSVAGLPNFPEHQRRILDEALRLIEPMDQPSIRQLVVALESQVEKARGER